jgi:hypothetical protein
MGLRFSFQLTILIFLLLSQAAAQGYVVILPDEVKNPFQARYQRISEELRKPASNVWAGSYYRDPGETWDEELVWEPTTGFAAYRETCSNGPRAWVNYGSATYRDGVLTLSSERNDTAEFLLKFSENELTPISWGKQHWLVPTKDLALFAYAINARSGEEYSIGYLKFADREKSRPRRPALPAKYLRLLGIPPIKASVVEIGKGATKWYPSMTISAGKDKGVIEGMSFWLVGRKGIGAEVIVTEVHDRTSIVQITGIESGDAEDDTIPTLRWRFTSRMPSTFFRY